MCSGDGEGKFGLGLLLRGDELDFLIGIKSWRCWRETEICRAMEISAADSRRSSRPGSSSWLIGVETEVKGKPKAELDTSAGRGRVAEEVVALRFRRAAGGDWITTCLCVTMCGVEAVEMLEAEVDVE